MCKYEELWNNLSKRIEILANHGVTVVNTNSLYNEMKRSEFAYKESNDNSYNSRSEDVRG